MNFGILLSIVSVYVVNAKSLLLCAGSKQVGLNLIVLTLAYIA